MSKAKSAAGKAKAKQFVTDGKVNICLIGQQFMGRAHSNAWGQVNRFMNPPVEAGLHTVCARTKDTLVDFAERFGWANVSTNYKKAVAQDEIDLVDVTAANNVHLPMVRAALEAGKAVACEKPLAHTLDDAREMVKLARKAKVPTFVWYNYRRCPAVAYAYHLVRQGAVGDVRHVRAYYLQDWADESVPLLWRFQKKVAGSGSLGDLCAHVIDMVRFVMGEEITEICGSILETFVKQREKVTQVSGGGIASGTKGAKGAMGKVTVDDAALFLARFDGGAVGHFEATRFATGRQNMNGFEINGSKGSLRFNFERMNELEYYDATGPRGEQGWRTIITTHAGEHPYAEHWWPDAHIVGYEHAFTNMASDILAYLAGKDPVVPLPDFEDAWKTQCVLEAASAAAREKRWVKMREIK